MMTATSAAAESEAGLAHVRGRLRELAARSDRKGLVQLGGHAGALLLSGTLVQQALGTLWLLPAMLAHGILLSFLFAPLHEAVHRTAFRTRWLNDGVAWACGALLLLPPTYFRAFHFTHHRFTQDPERDPELARPKPRTIGAYIWHVSGLPYWAERLATTCRHARGVVGEAFITPRQVPKVIREARLLLAAYAAVGLISIVALSPLPLLLWLAPAVLGQPFLRLYLLAEHTGCPLVANMLENSRTTISTALVRGLAWNMPYHAEHHAHPALPFHALPEAHALLEHRVAIQAPGYVAVNREIVAALGHDDAAERRSGAG